MNNQKGVIALAIVLSLLLVTAIFTVWKSEKEDKQYGDEIIVKGGQND